MPPRILIAEDDEMQGAMLRTVLQGRGYEAVVVADGLEAVRELRTGGYALALLDYHMPVVDGLAAAQLLHEFLREEDRPRLIAITAAAEGLSEKTTAGGGASFDAVVSKRSGLPALLSVVDANLLRVAEVNAAATLTRGRESRLQAHAARRARWLAPLAAAPALAMAGAFAVALFWAAASLNHVDGAIGSAARAGMLSTDTAALVGAMQDVETSQRTYLATGTDADRGLFETDAQHLDQMLVSYAPVTVDGAPGMGLALEPQTLIETRLRTLAQEAAAPRSDLRAAPTLSSEAGRDAIAQLREWAAGLVSGSQRAVLAALDEVRHNVRLVLVVLAAGVVYGLWNAANAVGRRWHAVGPALGAATIHGWQPPARRPLPAFRPAAPLLLQDD